jgi:hypothetical protein
MSTVMEDASPYLKLLEAAGIVGGLLFTGLSFRQEARARRAQTVIEITARHRELWSYFEATPGLSGVFELDRDMKAQPLTERERRFVGFVFNHLRATFYAEKAGIYAHPQNLKKDVRYFFCYPVIRTAWDFLVPFQDEEFAGFVKGCR